MVHGIIRIKRTNPEKVLSGLYHLCVALLPVLYIINVPRLNISLGTLILLGLVPHSMIFILKGMNRKNRIRPMIFLALYIYLLFRSDGNVTRIILCCVAFVILYGLMKGAANTGRLRKIIETFALINVILLLAQVVSYYILNYRIQYIPRDLIYEEYQNAYVFRDSAGLYRPSALFLEPAHFSQYCIFALISVLFPEQGKADLRKAFAIGLGCILTTSGMGIVLTFGVFGWYMVLNRQSIDKKFFNMLKLLPVLAIALLILWNTAFFQTAIQRIFSTVEGYNAMSGRTHNWNNAIGTMRGTALWFGYGDSRNYELYLTGLADTIYKYGIICVVLQALCFFYLMKKKTDNFVWCCSIVFMALFCVAHLTNFVAQVFYFGIIIADAGVAKKKRAVASGSVPEPKMIAEKVK